MNNVNKYRLTTIACFLGIFSQAIVCSITAVLFIPLKTLYGLSYFHLGMLVGINFTAQVTVDLVFSGVIDKLGYRKLVLPACLIAFFGLILFALTPVLFSNILLGLIISTIVFSSASGLLEIQLSPIVNAIPNEDKGAAMSLMHSFYAWGQAATVVVTTLFVFAFGGKNWQIIVLLWSLVPLTTFYLFYRSLLPDVIPEEHRLGFKELIGRPFFIIALAAIFFGASTENAMVHWASSFAEKALDLPKITGDLFGMTLFAVMLGIGRMLYGKYGSLFNMSKVLILSSIFAFLCYFVTALSPSAYVSLIACGLAGLGSSLLWPGTLVISADRYPMAGAWMFAILAASGDVGAGFGPWLTGVVVDNSIGSEYIVKFANSLSVTNEQAAIRLGILAAAIFPIITLLCQVKLYYMIKKKKLSSASSN